MFLERGCWFCSEQAAKEEEEGFTEFLSIWLERITLRYAFLLFFYSFLGDFWGLLVSMFIYMFLLLFFFVVLAEDQFVLVSFSPWYISNHALFLVGYSFDFTHLHLSPLIDSYLRLVWIHSAPIICTLFFHFPLFLVPAHGAYLFFHPCLREQRTTKVRM